MPDGKTHYKNWKYGWTLIIISFTGLLFVNTYVAIGVLFGYFLGRYIDPDSDQMGVTEAEGRMVNEIPILGYILYAISSLYGGLNRRKHRSFITHFPVVSTFVRCLFFFFWMPLLYYFGIMQYEDWQGFIYLGIFVGLSFADFLHWFADTFI